METSDNRLARHGNGHAGTWPAASRGHNGNGHIAEHGNGNGHGNGNRHLVAASETETLIQSVAREVEVTRRLVSVGRQRVSHRRSRSAGSATFTTC